ncbi:MAG: glycosyltransferase family 4 protein [Geminicoccaceae bacterium]|nr:glycosyltransferase family 4 protein [Geminicoccaceae bacterium]
MRILTLCYEYPPIGGGGAVVCREVAQALAAVGHEVNVVTSRMEGVPAFQDDGGVDVHRVPSWRKRRYHATTAELGSELVPTYRTALRLHEADPFDIVHCHFIVPSGLVALKLGERTGLPYVLTAHGSDVPGYNSARFKLMHRLIGPLWQRVVTGSAAVTTPSHFLEDLIHQHTDAPVHVIPNAFSTASAVDGAADGGVERRDRFLVVSRMLERKGVQHFIKALKGLPPGWEAVVAGDGPYLATARGIAAEAGVDVRFLGHVAREDLPALYRSAKVFVFPSLQENFPMVLLEAMAAGCAVVSSTAPGCLEVVGDAARLVAPGDVEGLHEAMKGLMTDGAAVADLRARAYGRVTLFAPDHVARQYERLFLIKGANPPLGVPERLRAASRAA